MLKTMYKRRKYMQEYYQNNKDKRVTYSLEYYQRNKDLIKEKRKIMRRKINATLLVS